MRKMPPDVGWKAGKEQYRISYYRGLKKEGSHGKLAFAEKGESHENPRDILHWKWERIRL
jgi:hypothetical protein